MELKEILAVSGQSGLFKYVAQSPSGVIVESLTDGKRTLFSANARVSSLSEIAIFTATEELPLAAVFEKIYAHTGGKEAISRNSSPEQMKAFFEAALPEYDRERVHVSDIKKVISWFNLLVGAGMTEFKLPDQTQTDPAVKAKESVKTAKETTPKAAAKEPKAKGHASTGSTPAKAQRPRPKV